MIGLLKILTGCAVAAGILTFPAAANADDRTNVEFTVNADIRDGFLIIHGTATVPDGAWIIYAAYRDRPPEKRARDYVRVQDHRFATEVNVGGWPAGEIKVDAHFQTLMPDKTQPAAVTELFGEKGERMTGHQVVREGLGYRAAVASTSVVKP